MHYRDTWATMLPFGLRWVAYTQPGVIVISVIIGASPFTIMFAIVRRLWRFLRKPDREMAIVRPERP